MLKMSMGVCGLAELMKEGLQARCSQPLIQLFCKSSNYKTRLFTLAIRVLRGLCQIRQSAYRPIVGLLGQLSALPVQVVR